MRAGKVVATVDPTVTPERELARLMIGSAIPHPKRDTHAFGAAPAFLRIVNLGLPAPDPFAMALEDISLDVFPGEIVGIAGVSGNGQSELVKAISGEIRLPRDKAPRSSFRENRSERCFPAAAATGAWPSCPRTGSAAARFPR